MALQYGFCYIEQTKNTIALQFVLLKEGRNNEIIICHYWKDS